MKKDQLDFLIDVHPRPLALEMTVADWQATVPGATVPGATAYRGLPIS